MGREGAALNSVSSVIIRRHRQGAFAGRHANVAAEEAREVGWVWESNGLCNGGDGTLSLGEQLCSMFDPMTVEPFQRRDTRLPMKKLEET